MNSWSWRENSLFRPPSPTPSNPYSTVIFSDNEFMYLLGWFRCSVRDQITPKLPKSPRLTKNIASAVIFISTVFRIEKFQGILVHLCRAISFLCVCVLWLQYHCTINIRTTNSKSDRETIGMNEKRRLRMGDCIEMVKKREWEREREKDRESQCWRSATEFERIHVMVLDLCDSWSSLGALVMYI